MITVYRTSVRKDQKLAKVASPSSVPAVPDVPSPELFVDTSARFQEIEGFGAMFTESAAVTLGKLPQEISDEFFKACFGPRSKGNAYSLCRTHINSCDFSTSNYSCCEVDGDHSLASFSIERDRKTLLPFIHRAKKASQGGFKLLASPWSPPAWMKTTDKMNHGGRLRPECFQAWADCLARFVREYRAEGVDVWGVTAQNEPEAVQSWDSCLFSAEEERDFVKILGPRFARDGLSDVKIIVWDHNRDRIYERVRQVYADPGASKHIWGAGYHWYMADCHDNLSLVHDAWPDKKLLLTEGYCERRTTDPDDWGCAEYTARNIIKDMNRWNCGFIGWNMLVDEAGGPSHAKNYQGAPIIADTVNMRLTYRWNYFAIGHFSRFVNPGARRVAAALTDDLLLATAFVNPDGSTVVVVLNESFDDIAFHLRVDGRDFPAAAPRHTIQTYVVGAEEA